MRDDLDIPMPSMTPGGASTTNFRVARQPEGLDPNTKRMAVVAAVIVGVFVVFAGVYSVMGHRRAGVPVIEADTRPLREKPKDAGGMQVIGKDETIMSGGGEAKTAISAPAEAPAPQALRAAVTVTAPMASPPIVATPAVVAAVVAPQAVSQAAPTSVAPTAVAPKAVQAEVKAAVKAPVAAAPVPASVAPGVVAVARAAAPVAPVPAAPAKAVQVQLAAVASEQAAHAEWQRLAKRMPDLFGGKAPAISKVERDGKTLWRVRTGGFADANAAKAFCEHVKAKAAGCIVSAS